jgi:hypothetical protein
MFLVIVTHVIVNEVVWLADAKPASQITQSLGYGGLSLSSDCVSTRNPLLEPTCLTDLPGSYCFHWSCGIVGPNTAAQPYRLEVIHR